VRVTFIDINGELVLEYRKVLKDLDWKFLIGNILEHEADAIVSPANSFGGMDGGIDKEYIHFFGNDLQDRVRNYISLDHGGELLVGEAQIVPTNNDSIDYLVVAPTMRTPQILNDNSNIIKCTQAIFSTIEHHNEKASEEFYSQKGLKMINSVLIPGLGTGCGNLLPSDSARAIYHGYQQFLQEKVIK